MTSNATQDTPVYLVDGTRTPFLKARGRPGPFSAADLAVATGRALLMRQPFTPEAMDEVVLGHRGLRRGVASLCIGGGQGGAMLLERNGDET